MRLDMQLKERSYPILIERGSLQHVGEYACLNRRVLVVTDDGVPPVYAQAVCAQCTYGVIATVAQGEDSKSLRVYEQLLQQLLQHGFGRGDAVVAVGGGVVGDLAGFVAASYMRGIDFINVPTTVLSQVDSSIGGKVAVNLGETKNIVGAFWQPKAVVIDPDTLQTLPRRQIANGLAEAVKAGLLADPELYALLETEAYEHAIEEILYRSLSVKKNVVEQDEQEHGVRAALNFGHTLGHAIESIYGLGGLLHGECVAIGMLPMIEDADLRQRTRKIYARLGLPERAMYDPDQAIQFMTHDKKVRDGWITLVKVPELGRFELKKEPLAALEHLVRGAAI